jgi:hypothetical protein
VNLGELPIKRLAIEPVKEGENAFEFTLPVTKKKVIFKFLTNIDEKERDTITKNQHRLLKTKTGTTVTSFLEHSILSIDGKTDKLKIRHFIYNMPAFDSRSLRQYINESEPGMDMTWNFSCSECGADNDTALPITAEFFWPSK